jgi:hypothetical protein
MFVKEDAILFRELDESKCVIRDDLLTILDEEEQQLFLYCFQTPHKMRRRLWWQLCILDIRVADVKVNNYCSSSRSTIYH